MNAQTGGLFSKVKLGSDLFVNLQAGKKVRLRILDYPFVSTAQYANSDKLSTRFTFEVYNYETKSVQLLSKGVSIFNQIKAIVEEYGEEFPMDCDIIITTEGAELNTKYTVVAGRVQEELPKDLSRLDVAEKVTGAVSLREFIAGKKPVPQQRHNEEPIEAIGGIDQEPPASAYDEFLDGFTN